MNKKGFTLVEVLIVIAIVAILLLVLVPNVFVMIDKNNVKSCNNLIKNIESAAKIYVDENKYDLGFECDSPNNKKSISFQTLVDYGSLKIEKTDNDGNIINPIDEGIILIGNIVEVTYNCDTKEFSYNVEGIDCVNGSSSTNTMTTYTVNHWQQNLGAGTEESSENYTKKDTDNLIGTAGIDVTPAVKTYNGFKSPTTKTITILKNGTSVLNYYYKRNKYTVSLSKSDGISSVVGAGDYYYGDKVVIDATVKTGYGWKNWTGTHKTATKKYTFRMPASDVNNIANAETFSKPNIPIITRTDYNTFSYSATDEVEVTGYYVSKSSNAPTVGTPSSSFALNTWTTATSTGNLSLSAGTYYVWARNSFGNISDYATIKAYTISRSQGTGTTLTTRYDSTSSSTGTSFSSNTVVLHGTSIWARATANSGYNTVKLKHGSTTMTASGGSFTASATETIASSATANTYTITLNNQSATGAGTTTLYGRYSNGIYLDSGYTKKMTTSSNAITVPTRIGYTFGGYYTETNGGGTQLISASGYITSSFTNTLYSDNVTLYAKWTANVIHFKYYSNNGSQTNFVNWDAKPTSNWPNNHYNYTSGTYAQNYSGYTGTGYYGTTTTGGILVGEDESIASYAAMCDKYGISYYTPETTINIYCQWTDSTKPNKPTITLTDFNTFSYSATDGVGVTGYYVSTSSTAPTVGTPSSSFALNTWTTATSTGNLSLSAGTYYVWARDAAGNVSDAASIGAYTVTRSVGAGSSLVTRYDSTSSSTGTSFSSNTVVLSGTNVWAQASANTGYKSPVLKRGESTATNPGYAAVTGNVTIASSATIQTYTVSYDACSGSGAPASQTKTYGVTLKLSDTKPTRTDYEFLGWSTTGCNATSATHQPEGNYTSNASATLYAVWKQVSVKLIDHIKSIYTSKTRTVGTNSDVSTYYVSYQDSGKTWGLMNDGYNGTTKVTNTTYLSNATQGNIRYFGKNPNNYIYFNCDTYPSTGCEVWRIIGIVDGKVKIIRDSSIGSVAWHHENNNGLSSTPNNWATSSLQQFLNGKYYRRCSTNTVTYYSDEYGSTSYSFNLSNIGLKANTRNMISSSTWYLGGFSGSSGLYADGAYVKERNSSNVISGNSATVSKNVGIMSISDYAYGADLNSCSADLYYYDKCVSTNYLFNGEEKWSINHYTGGDKYIAWGLLTTGDIGIYGTYVSTRTVNPVVYLDPNLKIEGGNTGSSSSPFRLKAGQVTIDSESDCSTIETVTKYIGATTNMNCRATPSSSGSLVTQLSCNNTPVAVEVSTTVENNYRYYPAGDCYLNDGYLFDEFVGCW